MRLSPRLTLACAVLVLVGCQGSQPPQATAPAPALPIEAQALAAANPDAVVVAVSPVQGPTARVTVVPPKAYGVQTASNPAHRWEVTDIIEYEVSLQDWNGTAYVALANVPAVHVTRIPLPPATATYTQAFFTNLLWGHRYRALVKVKGNNGGHPDQALQDMNAASFPLNAEPLSNAIALFDYTGSNDVNQTQSQAVAVALDGVDFNGSATVTVTQPTAGTYNNPTAQPTSAIQ